MDHNLQCAKPNQQLNGRSATLPRCSLAALGWRCHSARLVTSDWIAPTAWQLTVTFAFGLASAVTPLLSPSLSDAVSSLSGLAVRRGGSVRAAG